MNIKIKNYFALGIFENIAVQMFATMTYILLMSKGYTFTEIGYFLAVFTLVGMICEVPSGILVDTIGARKVLFISYLLRGLGLVILGFSSNMLLLVFAGILTGLASALSSGTLDSWIMNETDKGETNTAKLFSRYNMFTTFFGLVSGFVGAQILGNIREDLPFYVSASIFFIMAVYIFFSQKIFSTSKVNTSFRNFNLLKEYTKNIKLLVNVFKNSRLFVYFLLFVIPAIIDIGPSNQWQAILLDIFKDNFVGYYLVLIGFTTIFANWFIGLISEKIQNEIRKIIDIALFIDVIVILIMSTFDNLFVYLFLVHVFLVGFNSTLIVTHIHKDIVKDDNLRTSIISSFYTLEAFLVGLLLIVNGKLSDVYGIRMTWIIYVSLSLLAFILIRLYIRKARV